MSISSLPLPWAITPGVPSAPLSTTLSGYMLLVCRQCSHWLRRSNIKPSKGTGHRETGFPFVATTAVGMLALIVTDPGALLAGAVAQPPAAKTRGGQEGCPAALAVVLLAVVLPPVRTNNCGLSTQRGTSLGFRIQTWLGTRDMANARRSSAGVRLLHSRLPRFARVPFTSMAHFVAPSRSGERSPRAVVHDAFVLLFADCLGTKSQWGPSGLRNGGSAPAKRSLTTRYTCLPCPYGPAVAVPRFATVPGGP